MCQSVSDNSRATVPLEQSDAVVEACVADLRALLDLRMDDYFRESQGLDDLSEGLGMPVAAVREMTYREVCRKIADRVPFLEVSGRGMGTALWSMTAPYRREYERYQQGFRFSSQDIAAGVKHAKKRPGAPVPAWYPYITYYTPKRRYHRGFLWERTIFLSYT